MHQGRRMFELIGRNDLTCITMVREPIERSVSQILYLQRIVRDIPHTFTTEYLKEVAPIVTTDLSACLDHEAFIKACDSQIRTLGIMEDYTPLLQGGPDVASGRSILRPYPLPPLMDVDNKALLASNACRWLSEMTVVGTTENYAESVELVCDLLGFPPPAVLPRKNTNPLRTEEQSRYRAQLPPKLVAQLEELTREDRQVYDFARELFREQWSRYQARPRRVYSIAAHTRLAVLRPVKAMLRPVAAAREPVGRFLRQIMRQPSR